MDFQIISLTATILLAFFGYLATYFNNLRLTRRKERLELIDRRLNDFYGPLYVASVAADMGYNTLLKRLGRTAVFDPDDPPTEAQLAEWRSWVKNVLLPLEDLREQLILNNAHLIREESVPQCLLDFVAHVFTFRSVVKDWDTLDASGYHPSAELPQEVYAYAERSYQELKAEQLALIGGKTR